ncbi:MAG: RhuM family protein [Candidatus Omnitrophota bacterium]
MKKPEPQIIIYKTDDGQTKLRVKIEDETVWLSQDQMAELFDKSKSTINEHIQNIYQEKELSEELTMRKFGNSEFSTKPTNYYNLDVIISVGYRVKSLQGTQFRIWATQRLREYIVKGFTLDDERLKAGGGRARYFEELLQRIRDIRSSERNFYQKVTDIYATSIDYKVNDKLTQEFFATVQNKMHYAVHGHTAAEIIEKRADSRKPLMGLTSLKNNYVTAQDAVIAKNYLSEPELKQLNLIVSLYLDFAELQATNGRLMKMKEWIMSHVTGHKSHVTCDFIRPTVITPHKHIYPSTHKPNSPTGNKFLPSFIFLLSLLITSFSPLLYAAVPASYSRVNDDSGNLLSDMTQENDGTAVARNYFKNGEVMQEIKYNQRQQIRHIRYYPDGKVAFLSQAIGGNESVFTLYYPNGVIKTSGSSRNYQLDGDYKEYFPDGELSHVMHYKNNRLVDESGQPVTGTLTYYYKDGRLMETISSREGLPDGPNRIYHPDGYLMAEVVYENNAILSDTIFDREGKVLYENLRKK